jgi:type IV secretory pathway VirB9-like protein
VKPPILIIVSCGLALAANAHASTTPEPRHLQPNAPRTITVSEADTPPVIRTGLLQSTLILLPAEEKVATVFGGDTVNWVFDGGHVASRFISVKPKVAGASTDVHIVSDHGNEYTLQLREITGDEDPHFDSKIFIAPGDQAAKDKLAAMPVFVPAAELDKAKQEAAAAKAAQAAELKAEETKAETYRSQYPSNLHFDYVWDEAKGKALGLLARRQIHLPTRPVPGNSCAL